MKNILLISSFVFLALMVSTGCMSRNSGAATTGNAVNTGLQFAERVLNGQEKSDDARITSAIKVKFKNDDLITSSNINIDTNHGKVTLNGKADNQEEADRAVQLARSADGVRSVHSNLFVKSK